MAAEVVDSRTQSGVRLAPRRGMINRLLAFVDRLPGPAAVAWLAIGLTLALVGHAIVWALSVRPLGVILHDVIGPALIFAWFGWLLTTLNRFAITTFNEFRPVLGDPDAEDGYLASLTTIDDRLAILAGAAAAGIVALAYYGGVRPLRDPIPPEIEVVSAPLWGLTAFILGIVILHTIRQLRIVSRLGSVARNVDIFKPDPINSLARLTAVSALGLIMFVAAFILYSPEQPIPYVVQEAALLFMAVASFVLPLGVLHRRLVAEKRQLLGRNQDRLKAVLARIHALVDDGDLSRAESLNHTLTAVLAERDVLQRLHTWPWSAGTFRGFASALLLPIALIVFTQVIDRLLQGG